MEELKVEKKVEESQVAELVTNAKSVTDEKIEESLNYDSLSKLCMFLDICGCSAFCWLQKSLEEKADAMHQRVMEESVVLSANIVGNSSSCQTIRNVRRIYKNNLDLLSSNINNNNLNNSL